MDEAREKEKGDIDHMSDEKDVSTNFINIKGIETEKMASRKRKTESQSNSDSFDDDFVAGKIPRKKSPPPTGSYTQDSSIHLPSSHGVTIQELFMRVKMLKIKGLISEYALIKSETPAGTFLTSKRKGNVSKNRYSDVLCFDHSLVTLPPVGDDHSSSYINANFVDGYKQKNAFICTQGPLPNTFVDFWRMVWHNQTLVIVMVTRTVERSGVKCGQYWPSVEKTSNMFEELIVNHNGSTEGQDFIETQLMLYNKQTGESRQIRHLQFTSWPDHGVPAAAPFLDFLFRVRHVQETATKELGSSWTGHPLGPPIIVHCSAGIGRTGTFVTVDICLRCIEDVGTVDIKETVRKIRSQRALSIQVPDQYIFCHLAVLEHAQRCGLISSKKPISLADIE